MRQSVSFFLLNLIRCGGATSVLSPVLDVKLKDFLSPSNVR